MSFWLLFTMEFAASTQNPKKIIETPNIPINTKKFSKKKVCLIVP
jgi:hypothetical protein